MNLSPTATPGGGAHVRVPPCPSWKVPDHSRMHKWSAYTPCSTPAPAISPIRPPETASMEYIKVSRAASHLVSATSGMTSRILLANADVIVVAGAEVVGFSSLAFLSAPFTTSWSKSGGLPVSRR